MDLRPKSLLNKGVHSSSSLFANNLLLEDIGEVLFWLLADVPDRCMLGIVVPGKRFQLDRPIAIDVSTKTRNEATTAAG